MPYRLMHLRFIFPVVFLNPVTIVLSYAVFLVYLAYVVNNRQVKMECRSDDLVNVGLKKPLLFEVIKEPNISYEKVLNILRELRKNLDN